MLRTLARITRTLLVLILGVGLVVAGGWLLLATLDRLPGLELHAVGLDLEIHPQDGHLPGWGAIAVGTLLLGLLVTFVSITPARPATSATVVLSAPDPGAVDLPGTTVRISRRSLHALVAWLAGRVEGVRSAQPQVVMGPDGWTVHLRVGVWATSAIPVVADQLRRALQDDLIRHTGVAMDSLQLDFDYGRRTDADRRPR